MALPYKEALQRFENRRVKATRPLIPPQILQEDLPLSIVFYIFARGFLPYAQDTARSQYRPRRTLRH